MIVHLNAGPNVQSPQVLQVAYHEAGHAVIGSIYRLVVTRASIIANPELLGCVEYSDASALAAPTEAHIVALLAGQDAQDHASCLYGLPFSSNDWSDHVCARSLMAAKLAIADWLDDAVDVELRRWRFYASQAVHHHWKWVDRVARTLAVRKTLTGAEILELR